MSKNKRSEEDIDGTDKDGAIFVVNRPKSLKTTQNNQKETESGHIGQDPQEGVIKNETAHFQKLRKMGISYEQSGDFLKAIGCYEKAILLDVENSEDLFPNLAFCYQKSGDFLKAIECYEEAIDGNGIKNLRAHLPNLALCYQGAGNFLKAIECYTKATQLNPTSFQAFGNLGFCYAESGNLPKAIECYTKATQLNPTSFQAFGDLAICYQRSGNIPKAVEFYIKSLELQPDLCKIVFDSLRKISFDFKIVKYVTGAILKAIELNMAIIKPDSKKDVICKAHFNIAEGYLLYSTFDKSKEKLLLENAATHYYRAGSKEALEKILQISKDPVLISKAYYELGNFAFSENNYQKAVELYKKSLESQDKAKVIVGVYTQLALAYDKIPGKEKEKIEASKEATKYLPTLYEEISESTALPSVLCDIILSGCVGIDQYSEQHKNNQKLEQLLGDSEDITEVL